MAYATVEDLEAGWRPLTESEQDVATTLLDRAAVYIDSFVTVDFSDEHQAAVLKAVSCSMVQRAMIATESGAFGVTQQTISADIYSQTQSFSNPTGDLYFTKDEKRMLGIGAKSYLLNVRPVIGWDAE